MGAYTIAFGKVHIVFNDESVKVLIHQCKAAEFYYDISRDKYILGVIGEKCKDLLQTKEFNADMIDNYVINPIVPNEGSFITDFSKYIRNCVDINDRHGNMLVRIRYYYMPESSAFVNIRFNNNKHVDLYIDTWRDISHNTDYRFTNPRFKEEVQY